MATARSENSKEKLDAGNKTKRKHQHQSPDDEVQHLVDYEEDWTTSVMLHDDDIRDNPIAASFGLMYSNHSLLRSLAGKPIRTTASAAASKNNLRLTYVPEFDDILQDVCVGQCACCTRCPYCRYRSKASKSPLEIAAGIKSNLDKATQTDFHRVQWSSTPRRATDGMVSETPTNGYRYDVGDTPQIRPVFSINVNQATTIPCVDKPSRRRRTSKKIFAVRRPTNDLYLPYVSWMSIKWWDSFEPWFKRKYAADFAKDFRLTDYELQFCRKRFGYFSDPDQLQAMLEQGFLQSAWLKDRTEWMNNLDKREGKNANGNDDTFEKIELMNDTSHRTGPNPEAESLKSVHASLRQSSSTSAEISKNRKDKPKIKQIVEMAKQNPIAEDGVSTTKRRLFQEFSNKARGVSPVIREKVAVQAIAKKRSKLTVSMTRTSTLRAKAIKDKTKSCK